ncbi:SprT family zinc-dependent metalloprotease [Marinobacterium maritimum]|uniref:SprT family zinc-dependent metalloprotease n=1 Tax=Marinobacterium maritimum TaxID=500162 RepID=A0ABP3TA71_9GAMM
MTPKYQLLRSARRKTLAIQVRDGQVVVRAPVRASSATIEAFIRSRAGWIREHQQRQLHAIDTLGIRLEQGGAVPWQGEMLRLDWQRGGASEVGQDCSRFLVTLSHRIRRVEVDAVRDQLKRWFMQQSEMRLKTRIHELAGETGLMPSAVAIGSWRGRWGQCSSKGEVGLNWRLLQLTPALQDYVILHELCHLRHMNHGREFHALLRWHCPAHPRLHAEMQRYTPWLKW